MSYWKLVSRLKHPCRVRFGVASCRFVTVSVRTLPLKRTISTSKNSFQSFSSVVEESHPTSVNSKEHKSHETNPSTQSSSTVEDPEAPSEIDKDKIIKSKILYNTHLYNVDPELAWIRRKVLQTKEEKYVSKDIHDHGYAPMKSAALKYLDENVERQDDLIKESDLKSKNIIQEDENVHFPFADDTAELVEEESPLQNKYLPRKIRIEKLKALNSDKTLREKIKKVIDKRWMSDYEHFKEGTLEPWQKMYGTALKDVPVSKIPCGGCGAHFQCQEPGIPGYLPSEIFLELTPYELKTIKCQRCHFLKNYDIALDVQVPPSEYPAVLDEVSKREGLIILIIDLLDFPCSMWPGIVDLIGENKPVIVVGNKVDLLPGDHRGYLNHIKQVLKNTLDNYGLRKLRLRNIHLISARSGFGVEELITELQRMSEYKGDVFLLGCTNVGKSTLFNCLLQSDMCKVQAVDLVQRATTSQWPNTTLNLLKFPMMRPQGWKLEQRVKRLEGETTARMEKRLRALQFNNDRIYHMPSHMAFVGLTYPPEKDNEVNTKDVFSARTRRDDKRKLGLNENDPAFKNSRWCYDTPGVSHPDQILTLLTTEELLDVLPSSSYVPRTFRLRLGQSIFVGGLARVDFLDGNENHVWVTLFTSEKLPVTIVWTKDADEVYEYALGTEVLKVPHSGESRLARWPALKPAPRPFTVFSERFNKSGADLVLSSTGWISVTTSPMVKVTLLPWTPEGRGIHFRIPALIPYAVRFRGLRIPGTPLYHTEKARRKTDAELIAEAQGEENDV